MKTDSKSALKRIIMPELTCGCGKPAKYMDRDGEGACNKYLRCPRYEDLFRDNGILILLLHAYRYKRSVDGINGREWNADKHREAEARIEELEKLRA